MGIKEFLSSLGDQSCVQCGVLIKNGDRYYIEYPSDVYCLSCGKSRDR